MRAVQLLLVRLSKVNIQRLALVDVRSSVSRHLDDHLLRDLPDRLVQTLYVVRNTVNVLDTQRHHPQQRLFKSKGKGSGFI